MGAAPPLTVVTSTSNWARALAQAIPTALAQTYGDFEYLIIGDCCTDETEDLVRSFKDPRIVWRNLGENTGNQSGVNKIALEMARGDSIAYLNHDDLWFPDHLDTVLTPLRERELDVVSAVCLEIGAAGHHYRGLLGLPIPSAPGAVDISPMTTSVVHTARAARQAGGWIDWRDTHEIPTQDFFRRLRYLRRRFAIVSAVTSLKFHSGDRKNSYRLKDAGEQEAWAARMRTDPELRCRETMTALACRAMSERPPRLAQPAKPADAPAGWQIEQWRRMRGLPPMLDLGNSEPGEIAEAAPRPSAVQVDGTGWALISPVPANPVCGGSG